MNRRPPRFTRTDTLFPYTTLCRSLIQHGRRARSAPVLTSVQPHVTSGEFPRRNCPPNARFPVKACDELGPAHLRAFPKGKRVCKRVGSIIDASVVVVLTFFFDVAQSQARNDAGARRPRDFCGAMSLSV